MRVQAVRSDGIRLTFIAERFADGAISGKSEMLGECKVRIQDLDQLLIGGSVEKEATQVAYQNCKLQHAAEPKAALAERRRAPRKRHGGDRVAPRRQARPRLPARPAWAGASSTSPTTRGR